ncbi:MAG: bifunctional diaminohydroxyphosphoribosylaminopyrimidine deaminase/5-amino-6-(5-phosphoribosylamino)uracil reductase RibD, partial [Acidimicrobiia bacterium]|nr:bifunctional diaminohydroxyphosphoribosylaminopyrimidine deaminase/5-amino-6-(5-phosphoribosylamino)uracil reductase RibD [Acidimicrobiia bacterium]
MQDLMRKAIDLATGTRPHPNPRVGALVVDSEGIIVGQGAHQGPGLPHAEVLALEDAGDARGATVVTTLEPCSHQGRTPPCTDALINAGVAKVVVGAIDPDTKVAGSGLAALRDAGVEVVNVLAEEAKALDPGYFHHRRTGRARVTLKMASTLDGQTAAVDGTSQW